MKREIHPSRKQKVLPRVNEPICHLKVVHTGVYNPMSLNIRKIRRINVSRGNREGNNAFTKDLVGQAPSSELAFAVKHNVDFAIIKEVADKDEEYWAEIPIAVGKWFHDLSSQINDEKVGHKMIIFPSK